MLRLTMLRNKKLHLSIFLIILTLASFMKSTRAIEKKGLKSTYEHSWSPALLLGVTGKFPLAFENFRSAGSYKNEKGEYVDTFLGGKKGCVDKELINGMKTEPWRQQNLNSIFTYYLQMFVGMNWRLFGVCWEVVETLATVFYVLTILGLFAVLYLYSGSLINAFLLSFMSIFFFFDKLVDMHLYFRDYSKVPFTILILFSLLLLQKMLKADFVLYKLVALCFFLGGLISTGVGFRTDISAFFPVPIILILIRIFFFVKLKHWNNILKLSLILVVYFSSYKFLSSYELKFRGDNQHSSHVAILGQTAKFYTPVTERGMFGNTILLGDRYLDSHASTIINDFVSRNEVDKVVYLSKGYERAGRKIIVRYFLDAPFTFFVRFVKSFGVVFGWMLLPLIIMVIFIFRKEVEESKESTILMFGMTLYLLVLQNVQLHGRHYFFMKIFVIIFLAKAMPFNWRYFVKAKK